MVDTTKEPTTQLDALVIGGGVAGLWCLDALMEAGFDAALLESSALGTGQSISAQGILHGGVKYSLTGLLDPASAAISRMPERWDRSLRGECRPDLRAVTVRTEACHLWRTQALRSIAGMVGAKLALAVRPQRLDRTDRPPVLADCPGEVARLPEKVIETPTLMRALAALHPDRIWQGTVLEGDARDPERTRVRVADAHGAIHVLVARRVVLAAGGGTPGLLERLQLPEERTPMQRRPLHMAMIKGPPELLPELNGHCADGGRTRVTITSSTSEDHQRVWQLGGELSEAGCDQTPEALIDAARSCLREVLPGFDPDDERLAWSTYRIDRAERRQGEARRPTGPYVGTSGSAIIAWPTKLVMAPWTAEQVVKAMGDLRPAERPTGSRNGWSSPPVARPPWEEATWH